MSIWNILQSDNSKLTVFQEHKNVSGNYQAWDFVDLFIDCGFKGGFICCADGYENAIIFDNGEK